MGHRPVGERSASWRYCRDRTNDMDACYGVGHPARGTVGKTVAVSGFGGGGRYEPRPTHMRRRARKEAEAARSTYCGLALEGSAGGSEDNHTRVSISCPHGGFVHVNSGTSGIAS